jgi:hypothetical protein
MPTDEKPGDQTEPEDGPENREPNDLKERTSDEDFQAQEVFPHEAGDRVEAESAPGEVKKGTTTAEGPEDAPVVDPVEELRRSVSP